MGCGPCFNVLMELRRGLDLPRRTKFHDACEVVQHKLHLQGRSPLMFFKDRLEFLEISVVRAMRRIVDEHGMVAFAACINKGHGGVAEQLDILGFAFAIIVVVKVGSILVVYCGCKMEEGTFALQEFTQ